MLIKENEFIPVDDLIELYASVGWSTYSKKNPLLLEQAFKNSTYVFNAWEENQLIGLIRGLCDKVSINFIQDLLVHPDFQRKGIGRALIQTVLNEYQDVRKQVLLTDDEEKQKYFYETHYLK